MATLKNTDAKLWRQSPDSYKHMTLYGYQVLTTGLCKVCGESFYLAEGYKKSSEQSKHGSHMRPYHASCYIKTNGKYRKTPEKSTASLFEFLKD